MKKTRIAGRALLAMFLTGVATVAVASEASQPGQPPPVIERPAVREFIQDMVARHGFDRRELVDLFAGVDHRPDVLEAIANPAEAKPWHQYRPIFVTPARVAEGVEFWKRHREVLARAERVYGVPASILVAIIGVETRYGRHTGRYRVLDTLTTLAFDYPPRQRFFRSELRELLLLAREEGLDPGELRGSYAGAMGQPQFISSSYRRYAVDFNDDGRRDLWEAPADIIGSVANYFRSHGWRQGAPVAVRARVGGHRYREVITNDLKPTIRIERLKRYGVYPAKPVPDQSLATVLALETENGHEHWLGLHNFYVITRYNHSALYAMAVYQLSEAIAQQRTRVASG